MAKKDYTHIVLVVDGSYSMMRFRLPIIKGVNAFCADQLATGTATLSLMIFDLITEYTARMSPLADVKVLDAQAYHPKNQSVVLDAISTAVLDAQMDIEELEEEEKPESVIFLIVTDAIEQASSNFDRCDTELNISERWAKDDWAFVLISPNIDAVEIGNKIGIPKESTLSFVPNEPGALLAFNSASNCVLAYRQIKTENCIFTKDDKDKQEALRIH